MLKIDGFQAPFSIRENRHQRTAVVGKPPERPDARRRCDHQRSYLYPHRLLDHYRGGFTAFRRILIKVQFPC